MTKNPNDLGRHDEIQDSSPGAHSGKPLLVISEAWAGKSLAVSPDGTTLALGGKGKILLWNMAVRKVMGKLIGRKNQEAQALVFSPDGDSLLAYFKEDQKIRVYDTRTCEMLRYLDNKGEQLSIERLIRHPTQNLVFAGAQGGAGGKEVIAWHISTGEVAWRVRVYPMCFGELSSLAISSDGSLLAICREDDNDIRVIRTDTGDRVYTLWGHTEDVTSLDFVGTDNWLVSASEDNTVRLWDLSTGKESRRFVGHQNWIKQVCATVGPSGKCAYSAGWDKTVRVWDLVSGDLLRTLHHHKNIDFMVVTPDSKTLITSGRWSDWLICWDLLSKYDDLDQAVDITLNGSTTASSKSPERDEDDSDEDDAGDVEDEDIDEEDADEDREDKEDEDLDEEDADEDDEDREDEEEVDESDADQEECGEVDKEQAAGEDEDGREEADDESESSVPTEWDDSAWTLPTSGEVEWQSVIELCGQPSEGSIPTDEEWKSAKRENRVVTIHHSDTGRPYYAQIGLYKNNVVCRAVFSKPLPRGIVIQNVDLDDIDWDFSKAVTGAASATDQLLLAIAGSNAAAVEMAISAGADVTFENARRGDPIPLSLAIEKGNLEIVELIVKRGGANLSGEVGTKAWRQAILQDSDAIAEFLVACKVQPPIQDALIQAAHEGKSAIAEKLLAAGGQLDISESIYEPYSVSGTPLTVAAAAGHLDLVTLLLSKGADANARDDRGITPWIAAAAGGHVEICSLLESRGAKVITQTALVLAAQTGNVESLQMLLERGGDANAPATIGDQRLTPLEAVFESNDIGRYSQPQDGNNPEDIRLRAMELVLTHGANPNTNPVHNRNITILYPQGGSIGNWITSGRPLLLRAVDMIRPEALALLLKSGADIELADDEDRQTALFAAAQQGKTHCVQLLLRAGANPNAKNKKGETPLIAAVGDTRVVRWLIAFGADPNETTNAGKTLRQYAKRVIRKGGEDEQQEVEQAKEVLALLDDEEEMADRAGVFVGSPESSEDWFRRGNCSLFWLDDLSLAIECYVAAVRVDSEAIARLLTGLGCDTPLLRFVAARSLAELGAEATRALPNLIQRLTDEEDSDIAWTVSEAIAQIGEESVPALMSCLQAGAPRIARRAAITLCMMDSSHSPAVVSSLRRRLPESEDCSSGDDRVLAAEIHGICGDVYAWVEDCPAAFQEYKTSVGLDPDPKTGRPARLAFMRWKTGANPEGTIENSIGMRLVPIPPGDFMMGAPEEEPGMNPGEELLHPVRISRTFYLGMFAVTQDEYQAIMNDNPSHFQGGHLPVEHISWRQAKDFCKRLSARPEEKQAGRFYRLPTEAEWEYACRAGTSTAFSWGEDLSHEQAAFVDGTVAVPQPTVPVGTFPPNAFGLHEMHGNVWEWCQDWYKADYYQESPAEDPPGPEDGDHHVLRGGSASVLAHQCRAAIRGEAAGPPIDTPSVNATMRFQVIGDFGLRVVCELRRNVP